MTKISAAQQKKLDEQAEATIPELTRAREIAVMLLGDKHANEDSFVTFVEEVYDYLQGAEDEDEFLKDLKQTVEDAKEIYKTSTPTPRMVLGGFPGEGVFKKQFPEEE